MGEPKATDIPDAAAADRTSRFRAIEFSYVVGDQGVFGLTFVIVDIRKQLDEQIGTAACYMD